MVNMLHRKMRPERRKIITSTLPNKFLQCRCTAYMAGRHHHGGHHRTVQRIRNRRPPNHCPTSSPRRHERNGLIIHKTKQ